MNYNAKLTLSSGELALACDKNIILTKKNIIEKTYQLFNELAKASREIFAQNLQQYEGLNKSIPKIYKGENYNLFPYVLMDYPYSFKNENIFALRTMFWWGNFMSVSLHLSGNYKSIFETALLNSDKKDLYVCVNENQWQHTFEENNYKLLMQLTANEKLIIKQKSFIKIALKYELHHWNMMQQIIPFGYKIINNLLLTPNAVK